MTAQVLPMKLQSVNALTDQTKAAWDRADKTQKDADDWALRTGKLLVELKARVKEEGGQWLKTLEKMGRSNQRANELMQLAGGEVTIEQQRERVRVAVQKTRTKKKSLLRNGNKRDKLATAKLAVVDEVAYDEDEEDSSEQRCCWSLQSLFGDILSRAALLDRLYPGWRNYVFPSDIQITGKDAATELASLLKTIGVK